jgi:hypothetical protein
MLRRNGLLMLGVIALLAIGATGAFADFFDVETAEENSILAGTLDLKVDDQDDPDVATLTIDNMAPGDTEYYTVVLKNAGTIDGQPSIEFGTIVNFENGCEEPEAEYDSTCGDPGEGEGELGHELYATMAWRQGGGSWTSVRLTNNCGNPLLDGLSGVTVGLGQLSGCSADNALPVLGPGDEVEVRFSPFWHNPAGSNDNHAQGDSAVFDILFHLHQAP